VRRVEKVGVKVRMLSVHDSGSRRECAGRLKLPFCLCCCKLVCGGCHGLALRWVQRDYAVFLPVLSSSKCENKAGLHVHLWGTVMLWSVTASHHLCTDFMVQR